MKGSGLICPKCGDEFRPGFSTCPDCGVSLVLEPLAATATGALESGKPVPQARSKSTIAIFAAGLLVGAGLVFMILRVWPAFDLKKEMARASSSPSPDLYGLRGNEAVFFPRGKMLSVRSRFGSALIDVTKIGAGSADYRWRCKVVGELHERRGTGRVYENYEATETSPGHVKLKDLGSDLTIRAGPFSIEWSYSSSPAGYVYLDKKSMHAELLDDADFDIFRL